MQFLYPNVLFLMLLPLILLVFLLATNKNSMQKIFSSQTLEKLSISNKYMSKKIRNILLFISLICMLLSLARPVTNQSEQTIQQEIIPIVVAIDVSKSMLAKDISPTRLKMAKQKLLELIKISKDSAIGVVLFAKSSFIVSPITQDFSSLKYLITNLSDSINFDNGSNIYSALEASTKLLKRYRNKNLLFLSDGGSSKDYTDEIAYAKKNNIKVYTLSIAGTKPTPIKINDSFLVDENDNIVTIKLNEKIKKLSLATNGGYIRYSIDNSDIKAILNNIQQVSLKDKLKSQKYKIYTELFYYPLAFAILLLLFAFSSFPSKKLLLVGLLFLNNDLTLNASMFDFNTIKEAKEFYENKDYAKASESFSKVTDTNEGHYNYANALYKDKKYKQSLLEYQKVESSNKQLQYKKLHNIGNTYVKLNDLENAKKMYEKALKIQNDTQTKENLNTVNKLLNKKKKENKDKNKENKKKDQNKDKKQKQKDDKKKKDKSKKDSKDSKENKKNQKGKKDKQDKKQGKKQKNDKIKQNEMSDLEEKKWLKKVTNHKAPILLRKVKSNKQNNISTPW